MNACLALLVVVLSFAFGIDRTEYSVLCRTMGVFLHFFFFASLLWLGSYVVCLTRRLMPRKKETNEEVFNPVMMYYMVSWGKYCGLPWLLHVVYVLSARIALARDDPSGRTWEIYPIVRLIMHLCTDAANSHSSVKPTELYLLLEEVLGQRSETKNMVDSDATGFIFQMPSFLVHFFTDER